jgi:hypothetical protein
VKTEGATKKGQNQRYRFKKKTEQKTKQKANNNQTKRENKDNTKKTDEEHGPRGKQQNR